MSNITLNELRNSLRSVWELQGLNQNLINQLLLDDCSSVYLINLSIIKITIQA